MPRALFLLAALLSFVSGAHAQDRGVRGDWRTPGGATVRIAPCATDPQALCAILLQLEPNAPQLDTNNPDPAQHTRRLCGLQIGYGFHLTNPAHAEDGLLYDPKSGKTYKGVMSSEGDSLDLRGYVGFKVFGRSERWTRSSGEATSCR